MTRNQPFLSLKAVVLFSGFSLVCQNVKSVGGGGSDFDSSGFFRSMSWKWFEVVSVIHCKSPVIKYPLSTINLRERSSIIMAWGDPVGKLEFRGGGIVETKLALSVCVLFSSVVQDLASL